MKFTVYKTKKDYVISTSALAVAGMKREKELRLEVDSGVIVVLRPEMNAKKLLTVGAFLRSLSDSMIDAVAIESGDCSRCGDCEEYCECDFCDSREICRGFDIPDCVLEKAGIADQAWKADVEDGAVIIRAMPEAEADSDNRFPDDVPEIARAAFAEADVCVPRLREILCDNRAIPF